MERLHHAWRSDRWFPGAGFIGGVDRAFSVGLGGGARQCQRFRTIPVHITRPVLDIAGLLGDLVLLHYRQEPARRRGSIAPRQRRRQHLLPVQRDPLRLDQRQRIFAVHPEGQRQPAPFGARQTPARIGARLRQALAQQHPQPLRVARHRIDRRRGIGAAQLSRQRLDRRRSLRPVFGGAHREAAASAARARVSVASSSDGVR